MVRNAILVTDHDLVRFGMPGHSGKLAVHRVDEFSEELSGLGNPSSLAARSRPTETRRLESIPNAVPSTQFSCALILDSSFPVAVSKGATVLSAQPTATFSHASGESDAPKTASPADFSGPQQPAFPRFLN